MKRSLGDAGEITRVGMATPLDVTRLWRERGAVEERKEREMELYLIGDHRTIVHIA